MQKYELKKTIRFKLDPKQIHSLETDVQNLKSSKAQLSEFIDEIQSFVEIFEQFVFQKDDNKKEKLEKYKESKNKYQNKFNLIDIDYKWLRQYTTEDFFEKLRQKDQKKYFIGDISYLRATLREFIDEWKNISKSLKEIEEARDESKKRHSEASLIIQKFSKKQIFNFAKDFIQYANPKNNEIIKNKLIVRFKEIEKILPKIQEKYLPSQSIGICLAKASFNFYTVNKKPGNYDEKIKKIDEEIKSTEHSRIERSLKKMIEEWMLKNPSSLEEINLSQDTKIEELELKQIYELIKLYKSKAKASFNEYVQKNITNNNYEKTQKEHPLFASNIEEYTKFLNKTKQILNKSNQINSKSNKKLESKKIRKEIKDLKQNRGIFFKKKAHNYKNICNKYEDIARKLGQKKAQRIAIEKEKQESQMLKYWSLILEEDNKHKLILVPLKERQEVKNELDIFESQQQNLSKESIKLYQFISLTLRGLKKLCFSNDGNNDFLKNIKKELTEYSDIKGEWSFQEVQGLKDEKNLNEKKLIEFYQKTLNTQYAKKELDLKYFHSLNNVLTQRFQNISNFEFALERACYEKRLILIDTENRKKLLGMPNICHFEISSYDLSEHVKPIQFKDHTKIWKEFWTEDNKKKGYPIRLNPEISLLWRVARYELDESCNKKSRWSQDQWTLRNSFTLNAGCKKTVLSFSEEADIKNHIKSFNKDFDQYIQGKQIFSYGMDRGQKEKATLCILKENPEKPFFVPVKVYKFNSEYYSKRLPSGSLMIKNLSRVIEKENLFEIKEKPVFDLTTAKLISGKIVENGDVFTYLKLQEMSAKREIFKLKDKIILESNGEQKIYVSDNKKRLYVKIMNRSNKEEKSIYYWNEAYQTILSIEEVAQDMQNYLNKVSQNSSEVMINEINQLRKALSGNMVGILNFLHKKHSKNKKSESRIILEREQRDRKYDDDVSIALEKALYNKFQTEGLAPPSLSHRRLDKIICQDKQSKDKYSKDKHFKDKQTKFQDSLSQIGLIYFVDPENTSKTCPKCNKIPNNKEKANKRKQAENWFLCDHCHFDTKNPTEEFKFLDNVDKIAAYNLARNF